jgi:hypothetical protein
VTGSGPFRVMLTVHGLEAETGKDEADSGLPAIRKGACR